MKIKIPSILFFLFVVILFTLNANAASLTIDISSSHDDAYEKSTGFMYLNNSRLWGGVYAGDNTIGLRFINVTVPRGATITNAYIEIETYESTSDVCLVTLSGQKSTNAPAFSSSRNNITSRPTTSSRVKWSLPNNVPYGHRNASGDLSSIVQEIVNQADWSTGNSLVLFIEADTNWHDFISYDDGNFSPRLHIEYTGGSVVSPPVISVDPAVSIGTDAVFGSNPPSKSFILRNTGGSTLNYSISDDGSWLTCSPSSGNLVAGASTTITVTYDASALTAGNHDSTITIIDQDLDGNGQADTFTYQARIRITPVVTSGACGDVPVYTENLVNPAILLLFDVSGSMDWQAPLVSEGNSKAQTPDLTSIVQEIVDRSGWTSGNAMSFGIGGSGKRTAVSHNASADQAPLLHIEYDGGSIDVKIDQGSDDAEENSSGDVWLTSNDLDFGEILAGLRFRNVTIPQGVDIQSAYIEFYISENDSVSTNLVIRGEDVDNSATFTTTSNNISDRTETSSSVSWSNISTWDTSPTEKRIKIGKDVLSELIKDRNISWGFGTWTSNNSSSENYTKIHVGTKPYSATHEQALLDAIAAASPGGGTPLTPSLLAGKDYFSGDRADIEDNEIYLDPGCQPKLVINITDGLGNTGTTTANVGTTTKLLTDAGISVVGVGFSIDNAVQLDKLAEVSNEEGAADEDDDIYALHKEDANGVGKPFIANSKDELIEALNGIASSLKSQDFYGSAPAATTSVDYGNVVISAQFSPKDWSGDLIATRYSEDGQLGTVQWSARDNMPSGPEINAFTLDGDDDVISYGDSSLYKFYLCKPLGDIIDSTPKVVGDPAFFYPYDSYMVFRHSERGRTKLVYVGSNDGALHAFDLETGIEKWRFYPKSLQSELNSNLVGTNEDLCFATREPPGEYCHKYFVDGPSVAADVYDGSDWSTVLVTGLGKGGASYFALDITGGGTFGSGDDDTKFLWEFTDSQLGFASNEPAIGRVSSGASTSWGVFFGSGYSELAISQQATKEAYLFALNVRDKTPLWQDSDGNPVSKIKISPVSLLNDALSSPLIVDIDDDYIDDFIYTGNLYGSMYRVSDIGEDDTPTVSKLFEIVSSGHDHPITATATYAYDETDGNVWVYFGTGKYEDTSDKTTMDQQYFVGLRDSDILKSSAESSGDATYAFNPSTDTVTNTSKPIKILSIKTATKTFTDGTSATVRYIDGVNDAEGPWLLKLSNSEPWMVGSERVTSKPLVVGGVVYFRTFVPDLNVCAGNGESRAYSLDYRTGAPVNVYTDGTHNSDDYVMVSGFEYLIVGKKSGNGESSDLVFDGKNIWSNTTVDGVGSTPTNIEDLAVKLKSWREL